MSKEGIGENCEFSTYHPLVNLIFFLFSIGITMFCTNPVFIAMTFVFSWAYSRLLKGKKAIKFNLIFLIPVLVIMALVNSLFTHNGNTVLFYLNTNRITLEAFTFGIAAALVITCVVIWFTCFNVIMTSDKFVYLFGKIAPVLGLTLSMIFRFIPLLKSRFREISTGQRCMGRDMSSGNLVKRARQFGKELSILISWSLEASIETADSMEARGYGLKGRTSFHLFKFQRKDYFALIYMALTGGIATVACFLGKTSMYYYPTIVFPQMDTLMMAALFSFGMLLAMPIIVDIREEKRWMQSNLEM